MSHFNVKGAYRIGVKTDDGVKWHTKKKNLILNQGLNYVADYTFASCMAYCAIGTGSTAPTESDIGLETESYRSSTYVAASNSCSFDGGQYNITRQFEISGVGIGNYSEVGVSPLAASGNNLFSRTVFDTLSITAPNSTILVEYTLSILVISHIYVGNPIPSTSGSGGWLGFQLIGLSGVDADGNEIAFDSGDKCNEPSVSSQVFLCANGEPLADLGNTVDRSFDSVPLTTVTESYQSDSFEMRFTGSFTSGDAATGWNSIAIGPPTSGDAKNGAAYISSGLALLNDSSGTADVAFIYRWGRRTWILESGYWDDCGVWDDLDTWNDGTEAPPYAPSYLTGAFAFYSAAGLTSGGYTVQNLITGSTTPNAVLGDSDINDTLRSPRVFPFSGDNYYFQGRYTNNYATRSEVGALATGDFSVTATINPDDATIVGEQNIINRYNSAGSQQSFKFAVYSGGLLASFSNNGTSNTTVASQLMPITGGQELTVRMTRVGTDITFEYYSGGWQDITEPTNNTIPFSTALFVGTIDYYVGAVNIGAAHAYGGTIRDITVSGLNGEGELIKFAPSGMNNSGDANWSINRCTSGASAMIVDRNVIQANSDLVQYMTIADDASLNFSTGDSFSICLYGRMHGNNQNFPFILIKRRSSPTNPAYSIVMSGTTDTPYAFTTDTSPDTDSAMAQSAWPYNTDFMVGMLRSGANNRLTISDNGNQGYWTEDSLNNGDLSPLPNPVELFAWNSSTAKRQIDFEFMGLAYFNEVLSEENLNLVKQDMIDIVTGSEAKDYWGV